MCSVPGKITDNNKGVREMKQETIDIINKFDSALEDLIIEYLVGQVTKGDINEYYEWGNDCQLAEMLESAEDFDQVLRVE